MLLFVFIYFISRSREIYLSNLLQFYLSFYPGGIDNPSFTLGCKYLLFVCGYYLRGVRRLSYWFDNLGLIIEGNTYRRYTASSLPLWGNTDVVLAVIKRNFWRRCRGRLRKSQHPKYTSHTLISRITLFAICLSFSSPPLHKIFSVLFALFFVRHFLVRSILCLQP